MANFIVTNTNDSGTGSLRQAILNANKRRGADKIVFDSALSGETIDLTSGQMRVTDSVTIEGLGAENLTIDAGGKSRAFWVSADSLFTRNIDFALKDLTITGGASSTDGGAILATDIITSDINVTVSNSAITNSKAANHGGAIYFKSKQGKDGVTIENSLLSGNSSGNSGGAIFADEITIRESTISKNSSGVAGGGVFTLGFAFVNKSTFSENTTEGYGGGLGGRNLTVLTSTLSRNSAGLEGGGIRTEAGAVIVNSSIIENEADQNGGGISVAEHRDLLTWGEDRITLVANSTVSGNKAKGNGGGIQVLGQEILLAPPRGLVGKAAKLIASNVTITNNVADSDSNGEGDGGGIYTFPSGTFGTLDTKRFILNPGDITFSNSIIAGNFDTPGNNGPGSIAPDIKGVARGNANNLLGNTQGLTINTRFVPAAETLGAGSDIINANPGLGPLQDNGGSTLTHALSPSSPAINGGNNQNILRETFVDIDDNGRLNRLEFDGNPNTTNVQLPFDQRSGSFSRIFDETVDIGAFEHQNTMKGDTLIGTNGRDTLIGTDGNDTLIGKRKRDKLTGNGGSDRFVFQSSNGGADLITDFEVGTDKIVLEDIFQDIGIGSYEQAISLGYLEVISSGKSNNHSRLRVDIDGTDGFRKGKVIATVLGVTATDLGTAQNFTF